MESERNPPHKQMATAQKTRSGFLAHGRSGSKTRIALHRVMAALVPTIGAIASPERLAAHMERA
jgi:hypothetical protein